MAVPGAPTSRLRTFLRNGRDGAVRTFARAAAFLLRRLPLRLQAAIRERFTPVARMDYARSPILLSVDSLVECTVRRHSCRKEPETVRWIEEFVRPGEVLYDIGANVGAYSFVADRATGGKARVYAFEASIPTYAQLLKNILLNGCGERIQAFPLALSDRFGLSHFNYTDLQPGSALHALGGAVDYKGDDFRPVYRQPVLAYPLDDLVRWLELAPPNHIKLDVDGTELAILRGASRTLEHPGLRSILVEIVQEHPTSRAILDFLRERGFEVQRETSHASGAARISNCIFMRAGKSPLQAGDVRGQTDILPSGR